MNYKFCTNYMNISTYENEKRVHYADFAKCVANILDTVINAEGGFHLQQVQHRAKEVGSLQKKLEERKLDPDAFEPEKIKDLAGCRFIFYTNLDVVRFQNSAIIKDNFKVIPEHSKYHYPNRDKSGASEHFISINYVIKLKKERTTLPEYKAFEGMLCEIQVQTILNHAWSELAHDRIYKRPKLPDGFGGNQMKCIEDRMKKIMQEYIIPVGYEFQKVVADFERLLEGKKLFDHNSLTEIVECSDNNFRHEQLERFKEYMLPCYDDIGSVQGEIRQKMVEAVKSARNFQTRPIETPYGNLPGKTLKDIAKLVASIIDTLRYLDIDTTFDVLCDLYGSASVIERECWIESAKKLAENDLSIWKRDGPAVQARLVERIREFPDDENLVVRPLLIESLHRILVPELTGMSQLDFERFAFYRGPVAVSNQLKNLRTNAIDKLMAMFRTSTTDADRRRIKDTLFAACRSSNADKNLILLINENLRTIIEFWIEVAPTLSFELRQELEWELFWMCPSAREDTTSGEQPKRKKGGRNDTIFHFRDLINSDPEFVIYKTLVGYHSVLPSEWKNPKGLSAEEKGAHQESLIDDLVKSVTPHNKGEWLQRIRRCADTKPDDLSTFRGLEKFLKKLAVSKPEIMWEYLDHFDKKLIAFLPDILKGLDDNKEWHDTVANKLRHWISKGKYLPQIASYLCLTERFDPIFAKTLLQSSIKQENTQAVLYCIKAAARQCSDDPSIRELFVSGIAFLTEQSNSFWVDLVWYLTKENKIFCGLSDEQVDVILDNLIYREEIDINVETILSEIAKKHPDTVIDYFGKRLQMSSKNPPPGYLAVPLRPLDILGKVLSQHLKKLLFSAKAWFNDDKDFFSSQGGKLLAAIFPTFSEEFKQALLELVHSNDKSDLQFVVKIMGGYEGQSFLHDLCKEVIAKIEPGNPLLDEIRHALFPRGIMDGTFGVVEAYEEKKDLINDWTNDSCERVRYFAQQYIEQLNNRIAAECCRSDQEIGHRRLDYEVE